MDTSADRLRKARIAAGYETAVLAAEAHGWNKNTYSSNENGNAPFSYKKAKDYAAAYGVRVEWLADGVGPMRGGLVEIIGSVGANAEGSVAFSEGDAPREYVPVAPGGTDRAVALKVVGHSMRGFADNGALVYFERQFTPPTPDMMGHVVVLETTDGQVLVKRLLKGDVAGRYDLESIAGPRLENQELRWAAHITAIIPPHQARKILLGGAEAA